MGGLVSSSVSLSLDLSIISTTEMHMEGKARIARTMMRIMIVKIPIGSSNKSSTRQLSWVRVGSVVMESDERASVVEIQGIVGVEADVAPGVEEKAKERTVVALLVDPEEALLVGAGEEASEGTATEEPVVEAKGEIVEEVVVEATEETVVEAVVEVVAKTSGVEAVVEIVMEAEVEAVMEAREETVVEAVVEAVAKTSGVEAVVEIVMEVEVACKEDATTGVSVVTTEGALMVEVSVVTTEGALLVDAEVEEKAKERTVVALLVDPEEALLAGAGEEASEETAKEEPVVEAKEEIVEEAVVEAK